MPRPTKQNKNVSELLLDFLSKQPHSTVQQMQDHLEDTHRSYNKTSIYRALEKLINQDLVCRQMLSESEAIFELRSDHHAHLVCQSCGDVTSAPCQFHHQPVVKGFSVDHHHLTLVGTCVGCQHSTKE